MSPGTSSAEPDRLFNYATIGAELNQSLSDEARRMAGPLSHFEATCREYRVPVSHLPGGLTGFAGRVGQTDVWVRDVGVAFLKADGSTPISGGSATLVGGSRTPAWLRSATSIWNLAGRWVATNEGKLWRYGMNGWKVYGTGKNFVGATLVFSRTHVTDGFMHWASGKLPFISRTSAKGFLDIGMTISRTGLKGFKTTFGHVARRAWPLAAVEGLVKVVRDVREYGPTRKAAAASTVDLVTTAITFVGGVALIAGVAAVGITGIPAILVVVGGGLILDVALGAVREPAIKAVDKLYENGAKLVNNVTRSTVEAVSHVAGDVTQGAREVTGRAVGAVSEGLNATVARGTEAVRDIASTTVNAILNPPMPALPVVNAVNSVARSAVSAISAVF